MKIFYLKCIQLILLCSPITSFAMLEIPLDPFDPKNNEFESSINQTKIPEMGHEGFAMPPGFMEEARIRAEQIREEELPSTRVPSPIFTKEDEIRMKREMEESLDKFAEHLRSRGFYQIYPAPKTELPSRVDIAEFQASADSLKTTVVQSYATFNAYLEELRSAKLESPRWAKMEESIKAINNGANHLHTFFATSTYRGEYRYSPAAIHLFLSIDSIKKRLNQEPSNNKLEPYHPAYHYETSITVLHNLLERNVYKLPHEEKTSK